MRLVCCDITQDHAIDVRVSSAVWLLTAAAFPEGMVRVFGSRPWLDKHHALTATWCSKWLFLLPCPSEVLCRAWCMISTPVLIQIWNLAGISLDAWDTKTVKSTLRHHSQLQLQRCQALLRTHEITCRALMLRGLLVLLVVWLQTDQHHIHGHMLASSRVSVQVKFFWHHRWHQ